MKIGKLSPRIYPVDGDNSVKDDTKKQLEAKDSKTSLTLAKAIKVRQSVEDTQLSKNKENEFGVQEIPKRRWSRKTVSSTEIPQQQQSKSRCKNQDRPCRYHRSKDKIEKEKEREQHHQAEQLKLMENLKNANKLLEVKRVELEETKRNMIAQRLLRYKTAHAIHALRKDFKVYQVSRKQNNDAIVFIIMN